MTRDYLREFGTLKHPGHMFFVGWEYGTKDGVLDLEDCRFLYRVSPLTMDDFDHEAFEPCNCPAYPSAWLHTWGVGQCYRPSYWCGRCGEPCGTVDENGKWHAPDYPSTIIVSDCCREPVFHDYRKQRQVTA